MLLVTVVASSPSLQGTQSEFTDASGQYFMNGLPPGAYSLLYIYGDSKVKRENLEVQVGKVTVANAKINTQASEVITVKEKAPTIDAGSAKQGTTVGTDYLKNVPSRGRTWSGVLSAAGGSQGDTYGTSFSGSTSVENNYVVDGLNTSGVTLGQAFPTQGSQVLNNFIQEIEVITGGYNAEFGRSTGGVVNVVTKTGSNEFHGSVFGNVNVFNASIDQVQTAGNSLNLVNDNPRDIDFGFDLGGPIIKDKLWFYVGFAPQILTQDRGRSSAHQVDRGINTFDYNAPGCKKNNDGTCDGDNNPATTSAVGCENSGNCEGDGKPDVDGATGATRFEGIDSTKVQTHTYTYQFIGKINLAVTPEHQGQVTFSGQPSTALAINGFFPDGTLTSTMFDQTSLNTDLGVKWTSKFNDNKTQVDFLGGWHRYTQDNAPAFGTLQNSGANTLNTSAIYVLDTHDANLSHLGSNADRNETAATQAACNDVADHPMDTDLYPKIVNCPESSGYLMNSLVQLQNINEQRWMAKLTLTQRVTAAGHHQFKIGADIEQNTLDSTRYDVNGSYYQSTGAGPHGLGWERLSYVRLGGDGTSTCSDSNSGLTAPCTIEDQLHTKSSTFNWGAFAQDSWSILPNLTINAGLRYEQQRLAYPENLRSEVDPATYATDPSMGQPLGTYAMTLTDLVAPRVGIIYDWTKEGRSKIYANWGRFYESIPMDINNREFGGETTFYQYYDGSASGVCGGPVAGDNQPQLASSPYNCPTGNAATYRTRIVGASPGDIWRAPLGVNALVTPGIGAQYLDEFVAGVEYEVLEDLRVGVAYQNRRIGDVIEDMSTDGANDYFVGNPGKFSDDQENQLLSQIKTLQGADASDPRIAPLINRLNSFQASRAFDSPERVYNALQVTASKRFSRNLMVQASYTYSKTSGNYPGLFSPDTNQLDPNITSQYDLYELLGNRKGDLPFDVPHNFKLDGYYTFDLKDAGALTLGARLRAQSGIPYVPLAGHVFYGSGESYLTPRGSGGRTDAQFQADLHLAYSKKLGSAVELSIYFELFNLFNSQTQTLVDQIYSLDDADPVIGGSRKDLAYIKPVTALGSETGGPLGIGGGDSQPIVKRENFGQTTQRVAPLGGRLGASLSF